ncbi:hypothetical protein [Paenibacillus oceani]|uniref:Uncharacterized protein n=1 Tax=Paenibacillus oceani TaxID=2772510 RepID=A0A927C8J2_9BACL|nr:hypothetical protein [Paenibacillus oceani]MBD2862073.1 hypothetical protein [Paenibacillus oceani]
MVRIRFESIRIDELTDSSSVNTGINVIIGRTSREEVSESRGSFDGTRNQAHGGIHIQKKRPQRSS